MLPEQEDIAAVTDQSRRTRGRGPRRRGADGGTLAGSSLDGSGEIKDEVAHLGPPPLPPHPPRVLHTQAERKDKQNNLLPPPDLRSLMNPLSRLFSDFSELYDLILQIQGVR